MSTNQASPPSDRFKTPEEQAEASRVARAEYRVRQSLRRAHRRYEEWLRRTPKPFEEIQVAIREHLRALTVHRSKRADLIPIPEKGSGRRQALLAREEAKYNAELYDDEIPSSWGFDGGVIPAYGDSGERMLEAVRETLHIHIADKLFRDALMDLAKKGEVSWGNEQPGATVNREDLFPELWRWVAWRLVDVTSAVPTDAAGTTTPQVNFALSAINDKVDDIHDKVDDIHGMVSGELDCVELQIESWLNKSIKESPSSPGQQAMRNALLNVGKAQKTGVSDGRVRQIRGGLVKEVPEAAERFVIRRAADGCSITYNRPLVRHGSD